VLVVFLLGSIFPNLGANIAQVTIDPSQIESPNICKKNSVFVIFLYYKKEKDIDK